MKIFGNTQPPPSKDLRDLHRLCKCLEEKANIRTILTETATESAEDDDAVVTTTIKICISYSNNIENIVVNLISVRY